MNRKGLTLTELLAALVVLGIIATIAYPSVINIIKDKKSEISDYQKKIINDAVESYMADNISDDRFFACTEVEKASPYSINVTTVGTLIKEGYLSEKYQEFSNKYIKMTCYSTGSNTVYKYELLS